MNLSDEKEIEINFNRNQVIPKLTKMVQKNQEITDKIFQYNLDVEIAEQLCVQLIIHKRTDIPTMLGLLYPIYKDAQLTADELLKCIQAEICLFDFNTKEFIVKYNLSQEEQKKMDLFQFPMPLCIKPKELKRNYDNGYYYADTGSLVLNSRTPKYDINLEHLNRLNSIPLALNEGIARQPFKLNKWNRMKSKISKKNWEKYNSNAEILCKFVTKDYENKFYLTSKYDSRGRFYYVAYFINPQGTKWNKACTELYNKEYVRK